ncbi:MAG: outer membrane beta-barrel protein [Saprospiraceae bacterium]
MEKDYYKNIKDTFDNPPEYPYEPAQWDAMKERLQPDVPSSKGMHWQKYSWALLWMFPFFLVGGYTWNQHNQTNKKITALETALQTEINKNSVHQSDTIFNYVVINQYDTIYHTTTVYQQTNQSSDLAYDRVSLANQLPQKTSNIQKANIRFNEKINQLFSAELFKPIKVNSLSEIQQSLSATKALAETPLPYNEAALKQTLAALDLSTAMTLEIPLRDIHIEPFAPVYKQEINPFLFMRPTGFSLGVEGSLVELIDQKGDDKEGFVGGLTAEINFGNQLSMAIGGEYLNLQNKLESGEHDFSAYPIVEPDNTADILKELKVKANYLQIPFGFKYRFREHSRFKPYLGIGAIARKPITKELKYEFRGLMDEYYVNQNYSGNDFSVNTLRGDIGFEYKVYRNWNIYFEGTYDHDFRLSITDFEKVKYFNIRAGILYNFKKR